MKHLGVFLAVLLALCSCSQDKKPEQAKKSDELMKALEQATVDNDRYVIELACLKNGIALGGVVDDFYKLMYPRRDVMNDNTKEDFKKEDANSLIARIISSWKFGSIEYIKKVAKRNDIPLDIAARIVYDAHILILTRKASEQSGAQQ